MKKQVWKSKTVWFQILSVFLVLRIPEIRQMYCENPEKTVGFFSVLTIASRVLGSNIGKEVKAKLTVINRL